jgi:pseudouridine-5'-phosphate glycosidase
MELKGGMVVANPIPRNSPCRRTRSTPPSNKPCRKPRSRHQRQGVHPFLLARVCELTGGNSLASNIQLVLNNARLAAAIAQDYCRLTA